MKRFEMNFSRKYDLKVLLYIFLFGLMLFFWGLGDSGLIDETPAKFAAAARSMSLTGNWLTPISNGIPRFDKPPLTYWLMGLMYLIPEQSSWDTLGSFSSRVPSAFSSLLLMIVLGDTLMRWPQKNTLYPGRTAVVTALSFALSPFVMIWSRIAVSDALLCGTLGIAMLFQWRCYVKPFNTSWVYGWIFLSLAVLAKGPVAIILMLFALLLFGIFQRDLGRLISVLKPGYGLLITLLISVPWFLAEYLIEGKVFLQSFFVYHNFERFTSVVNLHQENIFFFILMLFLASLPFSPLLILGLFNGLIKIKNNLIKATNKPQYSLLFFSIAWLLSVFLFFTISATKLPSYWLPATPAAAIIIGQTDNFKFTKLKSSFSNYNLFWNLTILTILVIALLFLFPIFTSDISLLSKINDNEMKDISSHILNSGILLRGGIFLLVSAFIAIISKFFSRNYLLNLQIPILLFNFSTFIPLFRIVDIHRQLSLREASGAMVNLRNLNEPLAMVGINKPSVHFYTNSIILYESSNINNLVNLSERLELEKRIGWEGSVIGKSPGSKSVLVLIDNDTSELHHWMILDPIELGRFGIYNLWRVDRFKLNEVANAFRKNLKIESDWRKYNPERY
tara:strand:- start:730 stop:2589 length:1860 start_codon:yes stop_codon:yes gene_type:complete